jgi:MTH538 TIR-like domain (DUF1863)
MTTYVAFDGDKDIWAYRFMRGWSANKRIDFELLDAHDLDNMTDRARGEYYIKGKLRERMNKSKAFVLLVGESTRYLHKYVGWEIDLAVELGLPIIVVNLNNKPCCARTRTWDVGRARPWRLTELNCALRSGAAPAQAVAVGPASLPPICRHLLWRISRP